jgi:predicted O-methyltransferase YrrM
MNETKVRLKASYPLSWQWISIAWHIQGWLSEAEGNCLFDLARLRTPACGPVVVEIGCWQGRSSVLLAAGMREKVNARLFCVDPFGIDESSSYQELYYDELIAKMPRTVEEGFLRNIRRCRVADIVHPIKGYSFDVVRSWTEPVDFLFIDANHEYESVHRDFTLWSPFVKPDGIVALHDVSENWPGPVRVMQEELQPPSFRDLHRVDSLAWAVKEQSKYGIDDNHRR